MLPSYLNQLSDENGEMYIFTPNSSYLYLGVDFIKDFYAKLNEYRISYFRGISRAYSQVSAVGSFFPRWK